MASSAETKLRENRSDFDINSQDDQIAVPSIQQFAFLVLLCAFAPLATAQCNPTFQSSASAPLPAAGGNFEVSVLASSAACPRTAASDSPDWLTISYGQNSSGTSSKVGYTLSPNPSPYPRTGTITVSVASSAGGGSATFTVTQAAANCSYGFSQSIFSVPAKNVASFVVAVNTSCIWTVSSTAPWITLSTNGPFTGKGSFVVTVADNTASGFRAGTIQINTQSIQVQQSGISCTSSVTPAVANVASAGGPAVFAVTIDPACSWTVANQVPWVTVSSASVTGASTTGPGAFTATAAANPLPQSRTATLTVAGQAVQISQTGAGISFSAASIQNAASFTAGALSPGEIFVLYGSGLGPPSLQKLQTSSDGQSITSSLAFTRVLFDGIPSPMIYSSATQVSAIVPYAVQQGVAHITVEYLGVPSPPITVNILPATPGIFTVSQSGSGQGAVLNQDYSANGPGNGETAGRVLTVYWTGGGILNPMPIDGFFVSATPPYPVVTSSMSATLGGVSAPILYSGAVPTLAPGILQTNILVPDTAPKGDAVPLLLRLGDSYATQSNITVAIR